MTNSAVQAVLNGRPELQLLLGVLGAPSACIDAKRTPAETLDWDYLITTASAHGVLPLFVELLLRKDIGDLDPAVTATLRQEKAQVVRRNFVFTQELLRLIDLFHNHDIQVIPYKGALLAATAYGDTSLRQFSDLDILVKPQDLFKVKRLLEDQGYRERFIHGHRPVAELTDNQETNFLKHHLEYELQRRDGLLIDLHWRLAPSVFAAQLDSRPIWTRLQEYSLQGKRVVSFCAEDMVLVLCMHGCKDSWRKLIWVIDLQRTIQRSSDIDWAVVLARATAARIRPQLLLGLQLVRDLFDEPLPAPATPDLITEFDTRVLATEVIEALFRQPAQGTDWNPITRLNVKLCENLGDKVTYLGRAFFVPRVADWAIVRLPERLYALYYLVRPLRICARWLKSVSERARNVINRRGQPRPASGSCERDPVP